MVRRLSVLRILELGEVAMAELRVFQGFLAVAALQRGGGRDSAQPFVETGCLFADVLRPEAVDEYPSALLDRRLFVDRATGHLLGHDVPFPGTGSTTGTRGGITSGRGTAVRTPGSRITKSGRQPPSRSTPGPATCTVPGRCAAGARLMRPPVRP